METKETTCENEELAKTMIEAGILRGIVSCPEHGHHNPYDMYKKGIINRALPNAYKGR